MTDLRYAWRQLRASPGFAAVAIVLMGLGIASSAAIFALVDSLLLKSLPVRDPGSLVRIVDHHPPIPDSSYFEYAFWEFVKQHSQSYSNVIGEAELTTLAGNGDTREFADIGIVTSNYFSSLGLNVSLPAVDSVVLSHRYWRTHFHSDPAIVGKALELNGHAFTIAGVTPEDFHGTTLELNPDVRIRSDASPLVVDFRRDGSPSEFFAYSVVARLKPGVTVEQAQAETLALYDSWENEYVRQHPAVSKETIHYNGELRVQSIARGVSVLRDQFAAALMALMAGVALVMLMVCSNVAGLLLERAASRERETAVRLAVGASPRRLIRQWLTESLLLALLGGLLGVVLARAAMPILAAMIPPLRDRGGRLMSIDPHLAIDWRVIGFALAACLLSAVIAGLAPALRAARQDIGITLRSARGSSRVESGITVFQIALCTLLLIEAGLFARTVSAMRAKDLGYDRDHVVMFTMRKEHYDKRPDDASLRPRILEQVRQLPGVRQAAFAHIAMLRGTGLKTTLGLPGVRVNRSDFMNSSVNLVSPEYWDTMGIRVLAGRNLTRADGPQQNISPALVNRTLAERFFPHEDPLGKLIGRGAPGEVVKPEYQIVGVVSDSQYRSLREPTPPVVYSLAGEGANILHLRTSTDPGSLVAPVRELIPKLAAGWRIAEVNLLRDEAERSIWKELLVAKLAIGFAAVAAILAAIGLYGTLAYWVARNRRGIGIRVAIGAAQSDVIRLLAGRVARLIAVGAILGLAAAFTLGESVRALLFEIAPRDGAVMSLAIAVVILLAASALAIPAWRALRIDPAIILRED